MRLLGVESEQVVPIQLWALARQTHEDVLDDVQPGGASRMDLVDGRVVQFVHVQLENAFFGADQEVLVARLRMDPGGGAVDAQRAAVEDLGEAGAHQDLGRGRQAVGDGSGRSVSTAVRSFRGHGRCVVKQVGLGVFFWAEGEYEYEMASMRW